MTILFDRRSLLKSALATAFVAKHACAEERPTSTSRRVVRSSHVGMNIAGIAYWTTQFPFADLMKNSSGWGSLDRNGGNTGTLVLTPAGYPASLEPGQRATNAVAWDDSGYATGRYVVLWEGEGELEFPGLADRVASRAPGRAVLDVANNRAQMHVVIVRTNPANPIRNIRFLWPGCEATYASQPFNPLFLARTAPFATLRFMEWATANRTPLMRWADRPRPADLNYATDRGVPVELMIDLANTLQADPWFAIPHLADDDYIREFATLVKARLDPRLTAIIEYSNEVWNGSFAQTGWALAQSARLGLPTPSGLASAFYAERVLKIVAIFTEVFGRRERERERERERDRERKRWSVVVAAQAAWTQFAIEALAWKDTATKVDALAIAPYFQAQDAADPAKVGTTLGLDSTAIHEQMLVSIRGEVRSRIAAHSQLARRYNLRLVGYEGGAHDSSSYFPADKQEAMTALFAAAHRHPRMREVYREYFESWIAAGGGVLMQYCDVGKWSQWGLWSVLESTTQDPATAPKYQALLDVIAAHPR